MASSGAAALIVGPLGANPAFLALPPFAGAAWYTVWHKRAPPEPPTHADQLAVQGKRIDEEVERAQKLIDV